MIKTATQLKDLIRNLSKKKFADARATMDIDATIKGEALQAIARKRETEYHLKDA